MTLVCCRDCDHFAKDPITHHGYGIGHCGEFEAYIAKRPSKSGIRQALLTLGNSPDIDIFWGGTLKDRDCKKYARKEKPTDPGKGSVGFNENLTTGKIIS